MIVILSSNVAENSKEYRLTLDYLSRLPGIATRIHNVQGAQQVLTEIYLIGDTKTLSVEDIRVLPGVERVIRVSEEYRILGRHRDGQRVSGFEYNGVSFSQDTLNVFAGLCERVRWFVRRRYLRTCRTNAKGFAGSWSGLHPDGRLQAPH